jgi:hypothetical protein
MRRPANKTERIAARYIPAGHTVFREVPGGIVYSGKTTTIRSGEMLSAVAFRGTAMNSEWNYLFKSEAQLNDKCEEFFASIKAHRDYQEERKKNRSHEETDTQKVKNALKAAGYNVVSVHRDTGTASHWIDITIDDYDEYLDSEGNKQRRYSEVMSIAKEASGRSHLEDDIQTDYFCVNINVSFTKYHKCSECIISNCEQYHTPDSCAAGCFYNQEMADWDEKKRAAWKAEEAAKAIKTHDPVMPAPGWIPHLKISITEEAI